MLRLADVYADAGRLLAIPVKRWRKKADLATSFIGTIELGTGSFTAETLIKLCKALGVSADYILFGTEQQSDLSTINAMLSGLDASYLPYVEELLSCLRQVHYQIKNSE